MRAIELFLDDVMMHAPGCPADVALAAIRQSAIEFASRSLTVKRELDPVDLEAGVQDYDFEPALQQTVHLVFRAWCGRDELRVFAPDELRVDAYRPGLLDDAGLGSPRVLLQRDEKSYSLFPVPREAQPGALTLHVALKPTRTATHLADVLYDDWVESIASGALYRLLSSPHKPYTDVAGAAVRRSWFERAVAVARMQINQGHTRAALRVRQRPFA
jgi:hypothetical protein